MEQNTFQTIIAIVIWTAIALSILWYIKKSYFPYRTNKLSTIMYGEDYFDIMVGARGFKANKDGEIVEDETNARKGWLWGLIPGRFYPYWFFSLKNDIKLTVTIKISEKNLLPTDVIKFRNKNMLVVEREIITDYIFFENTYYFGFKELETGNDYIQPMKEGGLIDFGAEGIDDPDIKKFSQQLEQLLKASTVVQRQVQDLENIDVEVVIADVVRVTNGRKYLFQQKDWYPFAETAIKSAVREICASNSYSSLIKMKTETTEIMIGKGGTQTPLTDEINEDYKKLNLGHKSLSVKFEEVDLGEESSKIAESLENIQKSRRGIIQKIYDTISKYVELNLKAKEIGLAKQAIIDIQKVINKGQKAKWKNLSKEGCSITHYYEGSNPQNNSQSNDGIAALAKNLSFVQEKEGGKS